MCRPLLGCTLRVTASRCGVECFWSVCCAPPVKSEEKQEMAESRRAYHLVGAALLVVALILALSVMGGRAAHAVPTTFTVTNTNDSGAGSLRQAIFVANANLGADTINFNIPGSGVKTISPDSELPNITEAVTINGYTQGDAHPNTLARGNNAVLNI